MNKSFWMPNGDTDYDNSSRTEPKRPHHWFMDDAPGPDWFCTKKQALESVNGQPISGFRSLNVSLWDNTPNFESGLGLFGLAGQNLSSNVEIRAFEDQLKDSSISLSMDPTFNNADGNRNFISMSPTFNREDNNVHRIGHNNFFPMGISYNRDNENIISVVPAGQTHENVASGDVSLSTTYNKADGDNMMMISSYDLLANNRSEGNTDTNVSVVVAPDFKSKTNKVRKNKEPKKNSPDSFPTNVKSLLSTGILDGVPVKYVSWGRDKSLRGIIRGSSYLCDCNDCKLSKAVNAYEFERHAGCKTKHPNNHIHFENGKTVYAVVQELKNTPQQNLFESIRTMTGSPINDKNFRIWKESYQAATRELQRIYGKNEVAMPSS